MKNLTSEMYSDQAMECRITECRMSLFYPGVAIGVARYFLNPEVIVGPLKKLILQITQLLLE